MQLMNTIQSNISYLFEKAFNVFAESNFLYQIALFSSTLTSYFCICISIVILFQLFECCYLNLMDIFSLPGKIAPLYIIIQSN